jgi:hypothetical protein
MHKYHVGRLTLRAHHERRQIPGNVDGLDRRLRPLRYVGSRREGPLDGCSRTETVYPIGAGAWRAPSPRQPVHPTTRTAAASRPTPEPTAHGGLENAALGRIQTIVAARATSVQYRACCMVVAPREHRGLHGFPAVIRPAARVRCCCGNPVRLSWPQPGRTKRDLHRCDPTAAMALPTGPAAMPVAVETASPVADATRAPRLLALPGT